MNDYKTSEAAGAKAPDPISAAPSNGGARPPGNGIRRPSGRRIRWSCAIFCAS